MLALDSELAAPSNRPLRKLCLLFKRGLEWGF